MRYIVSGYGPGVGGVPKLMEFLAQNQSAGDVKVVHPLSSNIKLPLLKKVVDRVFFKALFLLRVLFLRGKPVLIIHYQSVGLGVSKWLLQNSSDASMYVMDNGFFCVSAYNFQGGECLKCLGGDFENANKLDCKVRPFGTTRSANIRFQSWLKSYAKNIKFYTLSETNAKLLGRHLGLDPSAITPLYFMTNDLAEKVVVIEAPETKEQGWDVVYHAADIPPKGIDYIVELANSMPGVRFLVPTNKQLDSVHGNITAKPMRWESGLEQAVRNSRLIMTPSLWSYTPEAATLKSFKFNGAVAMVKNEYGFSNEIPNDAYLALTGSVKIDAAKVADFLNYGNAEEARKSGTKYFQAYCSRAESDMHKLLQN